MERHGALKILLRSAQHVQSTTFTQHSSRHAIRRNIPQNPCLFLQPSNHFSTTRSAFQQSAAPRKDEGPINSTVTQSREPDQHIPVAGQQQREARTTAGKRRDSLDFLSSRPHVPDAGTPSQRPSSPPQPSSIQTNRNPSDDFLQEYKDDPRLDYLRSRKADTPRRQSSSPSRADPFSSITALMDQLGQSTPESRNTPGEGKVKTHLMLDPTQPNRPAGYANEDFFTKTNKNVVVDTASPTFRISPSLGRTVKVDSLKSVDVARAFRLVEMKCNANSVKQDLYKQRFHERPGIKRKRLVMSRWRKRFKEAFKATVRRVQDMRRKGW